MLEKDRFDLIKANMLLKKQENQIYQNSITISNHQIEINELKEKEKQYLADIERLK